MYDFAGLRKGTNLSNSVGFGKLVGLIAGYEYLAKDTDMPTRESSAEESLEGLQKRMLDRMSKTTSDADKLKKSHSDWSGEKILEWDNFFSLTSNQFKDASSKQEEYFKNKVESWDNRVKEIEAVYGEKLRLEEPAKYWKTASLSYKKSGQMWFLLVGSLSLIGLAGFSWFFWVWMTGKPTPFSLSSIQGVVLFGSVAAIFAFVVGVASKLTFSSFHLMRDAQEREQLTHVYLALSKDNNVDESARNIVLQALFSRSETGLLRGESAPSMPNVIDSLKMASRRD